MVPGAQRHAARAFSEFLLPLPRTAQEGMGKFPLSPKKLRRERKEVRVGGRARGMSEEGIQAPPPWDRPGDFGRARRGIAVTWPSGRRAFPAAACDWDGLWFPSGSLKPLSPNPSRTAVWFPGVWRSGPLLWVGTWPKRPGSAGGWPPFGQRSCRRREGDFWPAAPALQGGFPQPGLAGHPASSWRGLPQAECPGFRAGAGGFIPPQRTRAPAAKPPCAPPGRPAGRLAGSLLPRQLRSEVGGGPCSQLSCRRAQGTGRRTRLPPAPWSLPPRSPPATASFRQGPDSPFPQAPPPKVSAARAPSEGLGIRRPRARSRPPCPAIRRPDGGTSTRASGALRTQVARLANNLSNFGKPGGLGPPKRPSSFF